MPRAVRLPQVVEIFILNRGDCDHLASDHVRHPAKQERNYDVTAKLRGHAVGGAEAPRTAAGDSTPHLAFEMPQTEAAGKCPH
jgi:hypothetical protein